VIDEVPMGGAGAVPDFTPYLQRIKDKKPDVLFVFVPGGAHTGRLRQGLWRDGAARGRHPPHRPRRSHPGQQAPGARRAAVGMVTMHHYNVDLENPYNKPFVAAWKQAYGEGHVPDFVAVGGYDGMAAIAHIVQTLKGKIDPEQAMAALEGLAVGQEPARAHHDRRGHARRRDERVSVRGRDEGRPALHEEHRHDPEREGCVQELKVGRCGQ
jgi:branched-chain amino acid transport system substrate-binding protein